MFDHFYSSQKAKLMKDYERACKWYRLHLTGKSGKKITDEVLLTARVRYESLIPDIPYIGGSKVHMTTDLLESVLHLSFLQAFKQHGLTLEESRRILYQGMETRLAQYPKFLLRFMGRMSFTKMYLTKFQHQSEESKKREYPGGFVFDVVIGDGEEFDWGLDFTECGIRKFYLAQNASEFLPIVCPIDYVLSDAFGYGLVRTKTLPEGAEICNPRMKKGRQTEWRFPDDNHSRAWMVEDYVRTKNEK